MNEAWVQEMRKNLESRATEDLLRILDENDRNAFRPEAFQAIRLILAERGATGAGSPDSAAQVQYAGAVVPDSGITEMVASRYRDAYQVAAFIVGAGSVIKGIAIVVAVLLAVIPALAFSGSSNGANSGDSGMAFLLGLLFGAIVGFLGFCAGVFVSAQGQMLRASLDSAVNSSPFLTDEERLRAMGIAG